MTITEQASQDLKDLLAKYPTLLPDVVLGVLSIGFKERPVESEIAVTPVDVSTEPTPEVTPEPVPTEEVPTVDPQNPQPE